GRAGRTPDAVSHFLLGRAQYHDGDAVAARAQMKLALEADPSFWPAHARLAYLALEQGNLSEADEHVRAALAAKPSDREALEVSARLAAAQKDWPRAVRAYERILEQDPLSYVTRINLVLVH